MRLVRVAEATDWDDPNDDSWMHPCTYKKVAAAMKEIERVVDLLMDARRIPEDRTFDFFAEYPDDDRARELEIKYVDSEKMISRAVLDANVSLHRADNASVKGGTYFRRDYTVPRRSSYDPVAEARRDVPNGRYVRKVGNFEEYYIVLDYALALVGNVSVVRGLSDGFGDAMNSMTKDLEYAMELANDFIENSEEYRRELRAKNR